MPVSLLIPCSSCQERSPGKLSNLTWAWWTAANDRIAYRQKLCSSCAAQQVIPLIAEEIVALICPSCGMGTVDDMDPVYLTAYWPGVGKVQYELPKCPSCACRIRVNAQAGATKLEDRGDKFEGQGANPGPQTQAPIGSWAALG